MNISSKLIEDAVNAFASLPGIGKRTALRLVLHLLKQEDKITEQFTFDIARMRRDIKFCKVCHNIADHDLCSICSNTKRNQNLICVVEDIKDVMAIENTQQFNGVYHVLNGLISPMDGIGPNDITIPQLLNRITDETTELIMALSPTIEGDTTIYYISKQTQHTATKVTSIARGISFGSELEYTDEITLGKSISNRLPFNQYLSNNQEE